MNKSLNLDIFVHDYRECNISLQELPDYASDTSLLQVFRNISNKIVEYEDLNWISKFDLIYELRRLRKYKKDLFFIIFNNYNLHKHIIPELINSLRVNLAKVSLLLVNEIFNFYEDEHVYKWVKQLIPIVLEKSILDPNLKQTAQMALFNLSENMFYEETILALLKGILNSNTKISEVSCNILIKLINNYSNAVLENLHDWEAIFKFIIENLLSNDEIQHQHRNLILILFNIQKKLSREIFLDVIQKNLNKFFINKIINYIPLEKFDEECIQNSNKILISNSRQYILLSLKKDMNQEYFKIREYLKIV